jgi:hypothetical protein
MKRPGFYFSCIVIAAVTLFSCHTSMNDATKRLELTARIGGIVYMDTPSSVIHIATTLFNPTKDTVGFLTMSCSYEDMFLVDTPTFRVQSRYDCYMNVPMIMYIPPGKKIDQFIMIKATSPGIRIDSNKIKIGMHLVIPQTKDSFPPALRNYTPRITGKSFAVKACS